MDGFEKVFAVADGYSMCGRARLQNLYQRALEVAERYPNANFVDCGVAAGGSSAVLAAALKTSPGSSLRRVYCFDTFLGLPKPGPLDTREGQNAEELGWGEGTCAADVMSLKKVCAELGVDDCIVPIEGLFQNTLPPWSDRIGPVAMLHMDGDWYDSTMQILEGLYRQVLPSGVIQIDDYGYWDGCRRAVDEFFKKRNLAFLPHRIDSTGVWLSKSEVVPSQPISS
jgi:hypothetical protein